MALSKSICDDQVMAYVDVSVIVVEELEVSPFSLTLWVAARYYHILKDTVSNIQRSTVDLVVPEKRDRNPLRGVTGLPGVLTRDGVEVRELVVSH
jgi:hypothetical protein